MARNGWGALVKRYRTERRLTQEQMAKEFKVATNTVSRWETGAYDVGSDMTWFLMNYYSPQASIETHEINQAIRFLSSLQTRQDDSAKPAPTN